MTEPTNPQPQRVHKMSPRPSDAGPFSAEAYIHFVRANRKARLLTKRQLTALYRHAVQADHRGEIGVFTCCMPPDTYADFFLEEFTSGGWLRYLGTKRVRKGKRKGCELSFFRLGLPRAIPRERL